MKSVSDSSIALKDLDRQELQELVAGMGEKPFHGRQIFRWLHQHCAASVEGMTDLPLKLREKLKTYEPLDRLTLIKERAATDGTVKALFQLTDGARLESVWMPEDSHAVICLSTQAGCALGCTFCVTGRMGFHRNLGVGEIADQVIYFRRRETATPVRNLVFMGMGEPLLNYANVVKAIRVFSDGDGAGIAQRRMTVSTAGVVPGIRRLAGEGLKVKLAISLNAPTDELRSRIMPINKEYPLQELFAAASEFQRKTDHRITFEYALMPGVNDTEDMIRALRSWLLRLPCKLNLIPMNPIDRRRRRTTDWDAIFDRFWQAFHRDHITLTLRRSRGQEIRAACGQLAGEDCSTQTVDSSRRNRVRQPRKATTRHG